MSFFEPTSIFGKDQSQALRLTQPCSDSYSGEISRCSLDCSGHYLPCGTFHRNQAGSLRELTMDCCGARISVKQYLCSFRSIYLMCPLYFQLKVIIFIPSINAV